MMDLKSRLLRRFRKPVVLGLDLGRSGVKIVRLEKSNDQKISTVRSLFYPEPVIESDPTSVNQFRDFLRNQGLGGMTAACNIEDPSLKIRRLDLPKMPSGDLQEAVKWQLRDVVEDAVELYSVRYTLIDEYPVAENRRLALQVYAVHKEAVRALVAFLKKVSLQPASIEPTSVAILAALDQASRWEKGAVYGVLDIGASRSGFFAMGEGKLFFSRPLVDVSGEALAKMFCQEMSLAEADGLALKEIIFRGKESDDPVQNERVRMILPLFYARIAIETQRSIDAFSIMFQRGKVDQLLLCGGGAALSGLKDYLAKNVAVKTEMLDPFKKWSLQGSDHHLFATAMGLALYQGE